MERLSARGSQDGDCLVLPHPRLGSRVALASRLRVRSCTLHRSQDVGAGLLALWRGAFVHGTDRAGSSGSGICVWCRAKGKPQAEALCAARPFLPSNRQHCPVSRVCPASWRRFLSYTWLWRFLRCQCVARCCLVVLPSCFFVRLRSSKPFPSFALRIASRPFAERLASSSPPLRTLHSLLPVRASLYSLARAFCIVHPVSLIPSLARASPCPSLTLVPPDPLLDVRRVADGAYDAR